MLDAMVRTVYGSGGGDEGGGSCEEAAEGNSSEVAAVRAEDAEGSEAAACDGDGRVRVLGQGEGGCGGVVGTGGGRAWGPWFRSGSSSGLVRRTRAGVGKRGGAGAGKGSAFAVAGCVGAGCGEGDSSGADSGGGAGSEGGAAGLARGGSGGTAVLAVRHDSAGSYVRLRSVEGLSGDGKA